MEHYKANKVDRSHLGSEGGRGCSLRQWAPREDAGVTPSAQTASSLNLGRQCGIH